MRINRRIRISPIRLIGPDGEQLGIVPTIEAMDRADDLGLDLVEVAPNSKPPVCRILDYGKLKYEMSKKDKASKKKQHAFQLKEMRYRPKIDEHDFAFKTKHVREFLESGSKVRAFVLFRGREMAYTERGAKLLERVAEALKDISGVETNPKMEGRSMSMVLAPSQEVMKNLKSKKADKPSAPEKTEKVENADASDDKSAIESATE